MIILIDSDPVGTTALYKIRKLNRTCFITRKLSSNVEIFLESDHTVVTLRIPPIEAAVGSLLPWARNSCIVVKLSKS